jgi:alpha-galactosidase
MIWNTGKYAFALLLAGSISALPCSGIGSGSAQAQEAASSQRAANVPPPMGWSSWNSLAENVNFNTIKAEADGLAALNASIKRGAKYTYLNIDEGWWTSGLRDTKGDFIINVAADGKTGTNQWPGGMKVIADYIHGKGLKAGIYIDAGPQGCGKRTDGTHFVGSDFAHYNHDFLQFAQWGYDFVKVDFCGGRQAGYDPLQAYQAVSRAIQRAYEQTGQLLTFSICDWGTIGKNGADAGEGPWDWGAGVGRMWRTTGDIYGPNSGAPKFARVVRNFVGNYHPEGQHTGYYNDPDMMVAGMGMTPVQDQAHVSLWAIAGAPMILGNDLSKPLSDDTVRLLTNPEVIAVDQDPLGLQGVKVAESGQLQVWAKLLEGSGQRAVLLFNNSDANAPMTFTLQQIGLEPGQQATVRDLWRHKDLGTSAASYTVPSVPAGGAVLLRVSGHEPRIGFIQPTGPGSCTKCVQNGRAKNLSTVTFSGIQAHTDGGYVEISYINPTRKALQATLVTNDGRPTTLAFPPSETNGRPGMAIAFVDLKAGSNAFKIAPVDGAGSDLKLRSIAIIPAPVRLQ